MGTDLPSLWALQGMFLFTVRGLRHKLPDRALLHRQPHHDRGRRRARGHPDRRPIHAVYRNDHGYVEGRNLYAHAAGELTREWREVTGVPLSAVSGDGSLAFATAFYSPDHPHKAAPFEYEPTLGLPAGTPLDRGWAALCFRNQESCNRWTEWGASQTGHFGGGPV
ncbi:hypothetical protein [Bradyrhizobium amphicarpaeae]|uniref:hypothetical protein n=1 Tax=Bradyrhizobium amphicarpaeae TaxID=1404768 RepID=UPI001875E570